MSVSGELIHKFIYKNNMSEGQCGVLYGQNRGMDFTFATIADNKVLKGIEKKITLWNIPIPKTGKTSQLIVMSLLLYDSEYAIMCKNIITPAKNKTRQSDVQFGLLIPVSFYKGKDKVECANFFEYLYTVHLNKNIESEFNANTVTRKEVENAMNNYESQQKVYVDFEMPISDGISGHENICIKLDERISVENALNLGVFSAFELLKKRGQEVIEKGIISYCPIGFDAPAGISIAVRIDINKTKKSIIGWKTTQTIVFSVVISMLIICCIALYTNNTELRERNGELQQSLIERESKIKDSETKIKDLETKIKDSEAKIKDLETKMNNLRK